MIVDRENNLLDVADKKLRLDDVINRLSAKKSNAVGEVLKGINVPRALRINALRAVLNDYTKIAKELDLTDEFMYRLNWYSKFSEVQLTIFWEQLAEKNADRFDVAKETEKLKKTFYLLLLMNGEALGISFQTLKYLIGLPDAKNESMADFMAGLDPIFYDFHYHLDGMSYEDVNTVLGKSSTVNDIRRIAEKYGVDVPKRLKKDEFVQLVCDALRRQGKYSEEQEAELDKMSAITLQRFAKVNNIKASTEMKKEDVIDYLMNHLEASPKFHQKQRIDLENLPELEEYKFHTNFLREDLVAEDEDTGAILDSEIVDDSVFNDLLAEEKPEEDLTSELEFEQAEEPQPEPEPEPQPEPEPEPQPEPEPEPQPEPEPEPEEEPNYEEELDELEEVSSKEESNAKLLNEIVEILNERDKKDLVADLLEDSRYQTVMRMYEDRIAFLENMINEMKNNREPQPCQQPMQPQAIHITVNMPQQETKVEYVAPAQEAHQEEPKEEVQPEPQPEPEVEPVPVVVEEVKEEPQEPQPLEPVAHDSEFGDLESDEQRTAAKELMADSQRVILEYKDDYDKKGKQSKKLSKAEKKQAKIDKMRRANERSLYKKNRRRRIRKAIRTIIFLIILLALLITVYGILFIRKADAWTWLKATEPVYNLLFGKLAFLGKYITWVNDFLTKAIAWVKGIFGK